jgi:hypothetical protein
MQDFQDLEMAQCKKNSQQQFVTLGTWKGRRKKSRKTGRKRGLLAFSRNSMGRML